MRFHDISEDQPIQPRWAVGTHADKAIGWAKTQLKKPSMVVVWANIEDLFRNTVRGFELDLSDPTGGENAIGNRIARAKHHWANNGWMNPSDVYIHPNGMVDWGDGRHRVAAAYHMGSRWAPVLMDQESFEHLKTSNIRYKDHIKEVTLYHNAQHRPEKLDKPTGKKVDTINGIDVYQGGSSPNVDEAKVKRFSLAIDDQEIGYIQLTNVGNNYHEIPYVYVDPKHSRQGYGYFLYLYVILKRKYNIVSREALTQYGQSIWRRLIQDPRITVYGIDKYSEYQDIVPVFADGNSLSSITGLDMKDVTLVARSTRDLPDDIGQALIHSQTAA